MYSAHCCLTHYKYGITHYECGRTTKDYHVLWYPIWDTLFFGNVWACSFMVDLLVQTRSFPILPINTPSYRIHWSESHVSLRLSFCLSLQIFVVTLWNLELYMIPLFLLLLFAYNFTMITTGKVNSQDNLVSRRSIDFCPILSFQLQ